MEGDDLKTALEHDTARRLGGHAPSSIAKHEVPRCGEALLASQVAAILLSKANRIAEAMLVENDKERYLSMLNDINLLLDAVLAADRLVDRMLSR